MSKQSKKRILNYKSILHTFKMKTNKQLGIYIDYSNAYLMELINKMIVSRNIEFELKKNSGGNNDNNQGTIESIEEHQLQSAYFLDMCDIIKNYNQVVLFGPTDIKNELFKLLEFDHNFDSIKIQNVNTGKMNEDEMHDFVKEYYR